MAVSSDYDWSRYTPLDNTGNFSLWKSAYKNIRFALPYSSTYTVNQGDMANLAGISFKLYGDVSLWRMLLAYNGLQDPIQEVYPGLILKAPSKDAVTGYLSQQNNNTPATFNI